MSFLLLQTHVENQPFVLAEQVRTILYLSQFLVTIDEIPWTPLKEIEETLGHCEICKLCH